MKKLTLSLAVAAAATMFATAAIAKDVCVSNDGGIVMKFVKVKSLKKQGQSTPLHGISQDGCVLTGTAYMGQAGVAFFDVVASCMPDGGNVLRYSWTGDATFAGNGFGDLDHSGSGEVPRIASVFDCATFVDP